MLATPEIIREAAQRNRVQTLLPQWREVPLYRGRFRPEDHSLSSLPIITKADLRAAFPQLLLPAGRTLDELLAQQAIELEHTSGTSEDRLPVVFGRTWWNEQEARALRLNKFIAAVLDEHPNARRATITSPACNGLTCPTVWASPTQRTFGNSLFINLARIPFVLRDAELQRMADEIAEWSPQFLDVDPVHGMWFALFCERHGIRFPSLRFVICSYEFVSVVHRRILARVFGVPVFNLYGSTETGHLLMENEAGEMKTSLDTALLEVVDVDEAGSSSDYFSATTPSPRPNGAGVRIPQTESPRIDPLNPAVVGRVTPCAPASLATDPGAHGVTRPTFRFMGRGFDSEIIGPPRPNPLLPRGRRGRNPEARSVGIGMLLATTLSNDFMPLLRYRIGDLVQRHEQPYGTDYIVHGRIRDTLTASDGRRVTTWQVDQCFTGVTGIAHYQLRQNADGPARLRYIPDAGGPDESSLKQIITDLEALLKTNVTTESVPTLLPEASGKFRLTCQ